MHISNSTGAVLQSKFNWLKKLLYLSDISRQLLFEDTKTSPKNTTSNSTRIKTDDKKHPLDAAKSFLGQLFYSVPWFDALASFVKDISPVTVRQHHSNKSTDRNVSSTFLFKQHFLNAYMFNLYRHNSTNNKTRYVTFLHRMRNNFSSPENSSDVFVIRRPAESYSRNLTNSSQVATSNSSMLTRIGIILDDLLRF